MNGNVRVHLFNGLNSKLRTRMHIRTHIFTNVFRAAWKKARTHMDGANEQCESVIGGWRKLKTLHTKCMHIICSRWAQYTICVYWQPLEWPSVCYCWLIFFLCASLLRFHPQPCISFHYCVFRWVFFILCVRMCVCPFHECSVLLLSTTHSEPTHTGFIDSIHR